jgi:hypothetical protein
MYVTGTHTLTASTSDNAAGYFWVAYGQGDGSTNAGLYKSTATTYLIESDNSSSTVDISDPGSEGFGMNVTVPMEGAVAGTGFGDNSAGVFGSLGMGPSNAELISYRNWGPQTTPADTTITYGARAGSSAEAGTYSETVTFVCGGYFGGYEDELEMSMLLYLHQHLLNQIPGVQLHGVNQQMHKMKMIHMPTAKLVQVVHVCLLRL